MTEPLVVRVPGDKSISHRALIFASLAEGVSVVRNILPSEDVRSTAGVLRALGCVVPALPGDGAAIRLEGVGLRGWQADGAELDCGNSGTTARLMLGALAGGAGRAALTGDASLRSRPMRRVTGPLAAAGARFRELGLPDRLPIEVEGGGIGPVEWDSPVASAQVKSALLLAALRSGVSAHVTEPALSRDHSERMLRALGVDVRTRTLPDGRAAARLTPGGPLRPLDLEVPGDFSSAAFLLALGLAGRRPIRVEGVCLNPTRTGLLAVLRRMGADIEVVPGTDTGGEPVGAVTARPSELRATTIGADEVPALIDEVPILAVLASRAAGATRIEGASELRVKESDRLAALASNLVSLGVDVHESPDGLVVRGPGGAARGTVVALHDHRIAMAFGVLGALPGNDVTVDTPAVAAVSFPGFWQLLGRAAS